MSSNNTQTNINDRHPRISIPAIDSISNTTMNTLSNSRRTSATVTFTNNDPPGEGDDDDKDNRNRDRGDRDDVKINHSAGGSFQSSHSQLPLQSALVSPSSSSPNIDLHSSSNSNQDFINNPIPASVSTSASAPIPPALTPPTTSTPAASLPSAQPLPTTISSSSAIASVSNSPIPESSSEAVVGPSASPESAPDPTSSLSASASVSGPVASASAPQAPIPRRPERHARVVPVLIPQLYSGSSSPDEDESEDEELYRNRDRANDDGGNDSTVGNHNGVPISRSASRSTRRSSHGTTNNNNAAVAASTTIHDSSRSNNPNTPASTSERRRRLSRRSSRSSGIRPHSRSSRRSSNRGVPHSPSPPPSPAPGPATPRPGSTRAREREERERQREREARQRGGEGGVDGNATTNANANPDVNVSTGGGGGDGEVGVEVVGEGERNDGERRRRRRGRGNRDRNENRDRNNRRRNREHQSVPGTAPANGHQNAATTAAGGTSISNRAIPSTFDSNNGSNPNPGNHNTNFPPIDTSVNTANDHSNLSRIARSVATSVLEGDRERRRRMRRRRRERERERREDMGEIRLREFGFRDGHGAMRVGDGGGELGGEMWRDGRLSGGGGRRGDRGVGLLDLVEEELEFARSPLLQIRRDRRGNRDRGNVAQLRSFYPPFGTPAGVDIDVDVGRLDGHSRSRRYRPQQHHGAAARFSDDHVYNPHHDHSRDQGYYYHHRYRPHTDHVPRSHRHSHPHHHHNHQPPQIHESIRHPRGILNLSRFPQPSQEEAGPAGPIPTPPSLQNYQYQRRSSFSSGGRREPEPDGAEILENPMLEDLTRILTPSPPPPPPLTHSHPLGSSSLMSVSVPPPPPPPLDVNARRRYIEELQLEEIRSSRRSNRNNLPALSSPIVSTPSVHSEEDMWAIRVPEEYNSRYPGRSGTGELRWQRDRNRWERERERERARTRERFRRRGTSEMAAASSRDLPAPINVNLPTTAANNTVPSNRHSPSNPNSRPDSNRSNNASIRGLGPSSTTVNTPTTRFSPHPVTIGSPPVTHRPDPSTNPNPNIGQDNSNGDSVPTVSSPRPRPSWTYHDEDEGSEYFDQAHEGDGDGSGSGDGEGISQQETWVDEDETEDDAEEDDEDEYDSVEDYTNSDMGFVPSYLDSDEEFVDSEEDEDEDDDEEEEEDSDYESDENGGATSDAITASPSPSNSSNENSVADGNESVSDPLETDPYACTCPVCHRQRTRRREERQERRRERETEFVRARERASTGIRDRDATGAGENGVAIENSLSDRRGEGGVREGYFCGICGERFSAEDQLWWHRIKSKHIQATPSSGSPGADLPGALPPPVPSFPPGSFESQPVALPTLTAPEVVTGFKSSSDGVDPISNAHSTSGVQASSSPPATAAESSIPKPTLTRVDSRSTVSPPHMGADQVATGATGHVHPTFSASPSDSNVSISNLSRWASSIIRLAQSIQWGDATLSKGDPSDNLPADEAVIKRLLLKVRDAGREVATSEADSSYQTKEYESSANTLKGKGKATDKEHDEWESGVGCSTDDSQPASNPSPSPSFSTSTPTTTLKNFNVDSFVNDVVVSVALKTVDEPLEKIKSVLSDATALREQMKTSFSSRAAKLNSALNTALQPDECPPLDVPSALASGSNSAFIPPSTNETPTPTTNWGKPTIAINGAPVGSPVPNSQSQHPREEPSESPSTSMSRETRFDPPPYPPNHELLEPHTRCSGRDTDTTATSPRTSDGINPPSETPSSSVPNQSLPFESLRGPSLPGQGGPPPPSPVVRFSEPPPPPPAPRRHSFAVPPTTSAPPNQSNPIPSPYAQMTGSVCLNPTCPIEYSHSHGPSHSHHHQRTESHSAQPVPRPENGGSGVYNGPFDPFGGFSDHTHPSRHPLIPPHPHSQQPSGFYPPPVASRYHQSTPYQQPPPPPHPYPYPNPHSYAFPEVKETQSAAFAPCGSCGAATQMRSVHQQIYQPPSLGSQPPPHPLALVHATMGPQPYQAGQPGYGYPNQGPNGVYPLQGGQGQVYPYPPHPGPHGYGYPQHPPSSFAAGHHNNLYANGPNTSTPSQRPNNPPGPGNQHQSSSGSLVAPGQRTWWYGRPQHQQQEQEQRQPAGHDSHPQEPSQSRHEDMLSPAVYDPYNNSNNNNNHNNIAAASSNQVNLASASSSSAAVNFDRSRMNQPAGTGLPLPLSQSHIGGPPSFHHQNTNANPNGDANRTSTTTTAPTPRQFLAQVELLEDAWKRYCAPFDFGSGAENPNPNLASNQGASSSTEAAATAPAPLTTPAIGDNQPSSTSGAASGDAGSKTGPETGGWGTGAPPPRPPRPPLASQIETQIYWRDELERLWKLSPRVYVEHCGPLSSFSDPSNPNPNLGAYPPPPPDHNLHNNGGMTGFGYGYGYGRYGWNQEGLGESLEERKAVWGKAEDKLARLQVDVDVRRDGAVDECLKELAVMATMLRSMKTQNPTLMEGTQSSTDVVKIPCAICLDYCTVPTSLRCGHVFCSECLGNALRTRRRCPTCREPSSMRHRRSLYV